MTVTLQLIEGFDHMSTPTLFQAKGWTFPNTGGGIPTGIVAGRVNGNALSIASGGSGSATQEARKTLPVTSSRFVMGVAFNLATISATIDHSLFAVRAAGTQQFMVGFSPLGKLVVYAGGTKVATGTTNITTGAWHHVELKGVNNGAAGTAELHYEGAPEAAPVTANFGLSPADSISLLVQEGAEPFGHNIRYDDVFFLDTSAAPNNDFLGDVHVETTWPAADGTHQDWAPDSGTAHYSRVNETSPDGDTSYVASSTSGTIDSYLVAPVGPLTANVYAVQTNLYARKDDAGLRQLQPVIRSAGTDHAGATATLATSYVDSTQLFEQDPGSGGGWTVATVNAAEYGVKVV